MITPRSIRLIRTPDLRARLRAVCALLPRGWRARETAVILPSRGAAEELRRSLENAVRAEGRAAVAVPDLVTRAEFYARLHGRLPSAPPLLNPFEREVLLRLAAEDAAAQGHRAPFRVRPGLLDAVLDLYDTLRRHGRTVDTFDRLLRERLEPSRDTDRGAARLLQQTEFLAAAFASYERRVGDSGSVDEHGLRAMLLASPVTPACAHVVVCTADQAASPSGLWPADFDLLARMPAVRSVDIVVTEGMLRAGLHERLHDLWPGLEEVAGSAASPAPVLRAPAADPPHAPAFAFVCRDREEEVVEAARWIKSRAREGTAPPALERTALVFQRPLPYLYLARHVFDAAAIPFQAADALPLAAEPFAAALDLVFVVLAEDATRTSLVELIGSPHWRFADPSGGDAIARADVAALDRALREAKYLGGAAALRAVAVAEGPAGASPRRAAAAARALRAAVALIESLEGVRAAPTASAQVEALLACVARHERLPDGSDAWHDRHMRARGAVLGALHELAAAHRAHDDRPLPPPDLVATLRRWMEAHTFAPRQGSAGVLLVDAAAAGFADVDAVRLVGLVESDWPERTSGSIFYPAAILRELGWPADADRHAAARAGFRDLLWLAGEETSVSTFLLEDDAVVQGSHFLEEIGEAGLPVERRPEPAPSRILRHEALLEGDVPPGILPAAAQEWLRWRTGRTPAADARFHGSAGARPPEVYAVSRVERFLECPFKYYAGHVLRLEEERDDESGLTPLERGLLLHGVFEAFFRAWHERGASTITAANLQEAVALFAEVADAHLAPLPEADRALERTYLLGSAVSPGLAERAFVSEIEHGVGVVERLLEHPVEGTFSFEAVDGPRPTAVRGKADRIDLLEDGTLQVIDYKLGRAPKPARALQLPVYGIAAQQQLRGYGGRDWTLARAGYVAFRERSPLVELRARSGGLAEALKEGQQRFIAAVARIEAGEFPPAPDEAWTCTRCGFPHVCRKDYVGDE